MYSNQDVIDRENQKLKELCSDFNIGRLTSEGNRVNAVGVCIPIKGHSECIRKLEEDGWKKLYRRKMGSDYSGYSMFQIMEKQLNE